MKFYQVPRDRQAEPESASRSADHRFRLAETIEDIGQEVRADSLAGIPHRQFDVRIRTFESNTDQTTGWRELDRIRQQVPDNLLQPVRISRNNACIAVDCAFQLYALYVGGGTHGIKGCIHC